MDLKCEFIFPLNRAPKDAQINEQINEMTVGDVFYAGCTAPEKMEADKFVVKIDEKDKYTLKLLGSEHQDNKWVFKFTSYQVGNYNYPNVELVAVATTDAAHSATVYNLGPVNFNVVSVLNPQEKTEPFGPFSGLSIGIPLLYWLILFFAILTVISSISGYFWVRWQRKKLLARLEEYEVSTSPLQQFYATYRKLQREHAFFHRQENPTEEDKVHFPVVLNEMEQALKLYLLRKFKTPALEKKWSATLNDVAKYHSEFMVFQYADLKEITKEIEKAKVAAMNLKPKDLIQISEKIRLFIEFSDNLQDAILRNDKPYLKKIRSLKA